MVLLIDTSDKENIFLALGDKQGIKADKKIFARYAQEEKLLVSLQDMFSAEGISKVELEGIIVVKGPGSFSSLRIGLAVANALAWSWQVPILGFKKEEFVNYLELIEKFYRAYTQLNGFRPVIPYYGRSPNIGRK